MGTLNLLRMSGDLINEKEHLLLVEQERLSCVSLSESKDRTENIYFFFKSSYINYFNYGSVNYSNFNLSQRYLRILNST